jgi:hypothetical protein
MSTVVESQLVENCYQIIIKDPEYLERICRDVIRCEDANIDWKVCEDCSKILIDSTYSEKTEYSYLDTLCMMCFFDITNLKEK